MSRRAPWLLLPLLAGLGLAFALISTAPEPGRVNGGERATPVRTVIAEEMALNPVARGYGTSRPARAWTAVAELRGRIDRMHPELESGRFIDAGTELIRIDPEEYELAVAEAEAELAGLHAEIRQLDTEAENTRAILAIERARRDSAEADLERTRQLLAQGTVPPARLEEQERATMQFRRSVQELENALALIPVQRARLDAQIARTEVRLARSRRDLAHTVITAPFDLRVGEVHAERDQFVNAGQVLFSADGIARAEITAQVPLMEFQRLVQALLGQDDVGLLDAMRKADTTAIGAVARLVDGGAEWPARVDRVEAGLDPRTRTVQVVVTVDDPYARVAPPARLPLVRGMYLEVTLSGPQLPPAVVLPESAVHDGRVHVVGDDDRLEIRTVEIAFRQQGRVVLASGVAPGTRVATDVPSPAIPGMLLRVADDGDEP